MTILYVIGGAVVLFLSVKAFVWLIKNAIVPTVEDFIDPKRKKGGK